VRENCSADPTAGSQHDSRRPRVLNDARRRRARGQRAGATCPVWALLRTFSEGGSVRAALRELLGQDFEGVLLLSDSQRERAVLVNDILGPYLVYHIQGAPHAYSRSLCDVLAKISPDPDPVGAGQYLTLA
jgi:hypothetical protein